MIPGHKIRQKTVQEEICKSGEAVHGNIRGIVDPNVCQFGPEAMQLQVQCLCMCLCLMQFLVLCDICNEIAADQDPADKARLTFGKIISRWDEPLKNAIITILGDVLAGSNEAPLKKAVLDSGLAKSFSLMNDDSIAQPYFYFTMKDVKDGCAGELIAIVKDTAKAIIEKGLDRDELQAYINSLEFKLRDTREPAGLFRCFNAFSYWLHGGDPMESMCYDELFAQLRAEADKGGFEKVMAEMLLDERGMNVLHTLPSTTLGEEMRAEEAAKLAAAASAWTAEEKAAILDLNEKLNKIKAPKEKE